MSKSMDMPLWYTEAELAELMHLHPSTISRKVRAGAFPIKPLEIGARRLYPAAAVLSLAEVDVEH